MRLRYALAFLVGVLCLSNSQPVAALDVGDVAVIGVRADDIDGTTGNGNDDAISWVTLVDLPAGQQLTFTDAGWTAGGTFRAQEGAIRYTAPAGGLPAGTVMLLEFSRLGPNNNYILTPSGGPGTYVGADDANVGTTGLLPATPGDQIFIFEGPSSAPNFLWGWKNEGPFDADATSNDTSALPPGLTVGSNALAVGAGASTDNNRYIGVTSGTAPAVALAIANPAFWEWTETLPFPLGGNDLTNGTLNTGFLIDGTVAIEESSWGAVKSLFD